MEWNGTCGFQPFAGVLCPHVRHVYDINGPITGSMDVKNSKIHMVILKFLTMFQCPGLITPLHADFSEIVGPPSLTDKFCEGLAQNISLSVLRPAVYLVRFDGVKGEL